MITEIMGFLIIVGTIIVVLVRRQMQKTAEDDPVVLEASATRLREELEQSADEIIARMGAHIDRREGLIREADGKAAELQERIDAMEAVSVPQRPAEQPLDDVDSFSRALRQSIAAGEAQAAAGQVGENVYSVQVQPQRTPVPPASAAPSVPVVTPAESVAEELQAEEPSDDAMLRAQELLQMGCSTEQISKETNLGRGAIELMRQMRRVRRS